MADRNISSSDLDPSIQASQVTIGGINAADAITTAYACIGVPVNSTTVGTINAPGLTSPNNNTVKQLLEKIAVAVSETKATATDLQAVMNALIQDGIISTTNTWSSNKTKSYLDGKIEDINNNPNNKATHTYSQRVIAQLVQQAFDKALADIETAIYTAV